MADFEGTVPQAESATIHRLFVDMGDTTWAERIVANAGPPVANDAVVVSTNNSTTTPLAGAGSWSGTGEDITAYAEVSVNMYAEPAAATGTLYFEFSPNGTNWDVSVPITVDDPTLVVPIPLRTVLPYFRARYVNDATAQTAFRFTTVLHRSAAKHLTRTVAQTIDDQEPVEMVRAILAGQQPDADIFNIPLTGPDANNTTTSTLLASASYTGTWTRITGHVGLLIVVASDVASATNGLEVDFSDDGATVRRTVDRTYTSDDATTGSAVYTLPVQAEYYRLRYTNGGTDQGTFFLGPRLAPQPSEASRSSLVSDVGNASVAEMVRAGIMAPNDASAWANISRASSGGLRVAVNEHEAQTPIAPLTAFQYGSANSITSTGAVQICTGLSTATKSVSIKADPDNGRLVFIGDAAVTASNGYPLASGDSIDMDWSAQSSLYAVAASQTQRVAWLSVHTHQDS